MLTKLRAEFTDPTVQRGILVVISILVLRFGLKYGLDKARADIIAAAIWSALTVLVSRAPGKDQS